MKMWNTAQFDQASTALAKVGRFLAERGWSPATSSNYSQKLDEHWIAITRSGINKYDMAPADVIVIDNDGQMAPNSPFSPDPSTSVKPSAETLIHTAIYKKCPTARAVLHTHSPTNTRLSLKFRTVGHISFLGYEMQKGLAGIADHEAEVQVPILENSQNMVAFAKEVEDLFSRQPHMQGFLIAGHGLYTWGKDLPEAQRHVEAFEFLFECKTLEISGV